MNRIVLHCGYVVATSFVFIFGSPDTFGASLDGIESVTAEKAVKEIAQLLKEDHLKSINEVYIAPFDLPEFSPRASLKFSILLAKELRETHRFKIGETQDLPNIPTIQGEIKQLKYEGQDFAAGYHITLTVIYSKNDKRPFEKKITIKNPREATTLFVQGEIVDPPIEGYRRPTNRLPVVRDGRLYASENSPYSVEILVRKGGKVETRRISAEDNDVFKVRLEEGEHYEIKAYNETKYAAISSVSIDGVGEFSVADTSSDQKTPGWFIEAKKFTIHSGYFKTNRSEYPFEVCRFDDRLAKSFLKTPPQLSSIQIAFAVAWEGNKTPPGEPRDGNDLLSDVGTRLGAECAIVAEDKHCKVGVQRANLIIRYDNK